MIYSKSIIKEYGDKTGFLNANIEKTLRLLNVLNFIFSESSFKDKLVLKGGTAINLVFSKLNRLSVDIDLDYHGSVEKEIALRDREIIKDEIDKYMVSNQYQISPKARESVALLSRVYRYVNCFGNIDAIKVEINFMDRISIYPAVSNQVTYFDMTTKIVTPVLEELFAMKLAALIDRSKPRDLYDSVYLFNNHKNLNIENLKKSLIFYLSLDTIFEINNETFNGIKLISYKDVKTELYPVIKKGETFDLEKCKNNVIDNLLKILTLDKNERKYLKNFSQGLYQPSLLFGEEISKQLLLHPMAKWKVINLIKKK